MPRKEKIGVCGRSNPRLPIWKLVLEYGVLQSECRVRWAEQVLAFMTNRNRSKKQ